MKLFSFPAASLEKAIHKRILTLPSPHKEWFTERWAQSPTKGVCGKQGHAARDLGGQRQNLGRRHVCRSHAGLGRHLYEAEAEVLRPLIQGDGLCS